VALILDVSADGLGKLAALIACDHWP